MATTLAPAGGAATTSAPMALTLAVEEELLLIDPATGVNRPVADRVLASLPTSPPAADRPELPGSVVETVTGTCTDLGDLRTRLVALRRAAARAAGQDGTLLVAVGATPVGEAAHPAARGPRHQAMAERYGPVALDPAVCGLHVEVGVPDRETGVQVCNHLQVWLPVIRALTGNSPLFAGADTGFASWRSVQLQRWPTAGPTPWFDSADEYDRTIADLQTAGALLDPSMVCWYARLSGPRPAVEIRVSDVCADVDDTVLAAALTRAAVATALADIAAGHPAARPRDCVTTAAHWRAARNGLTRTLVDLRLGRTRPAWELVDEFFATVCPALLFTGDLGRVVDGLRRLRKRGTGAARQRAEHDGAGDLPALLRTLARQTVTG